VIVLRGIKELSIKETAEILNWKEEKVRLSFHRAIKALQNDKGRFM
jgi:RNA polymerase sigma-70 factor (ECF subfamily)